MPAASPSLAPLDVDAPFGRFAPAATVEGLIRAARACGPGWAATRRAFALRSMAQRLVGRLPVDVETFGLRMRLTACDNSCEKRLIYTPAYFDPLERALVARRLPVDGVFVDVGANVGGYALFVASLPERNARIVAVEPQREMCERLMFNLRANGLASIRVVECALADRDGEATLFIDPRDRGRASIRVLASDGALEARATPIMTLERLAHDQELSRIDVLKIDTVGADDLVLDAFFAAAPRALWPALLITDAAAPGSDALAERLRALGYCDVLRTRANVAFERRTD